MMKEDNKNNVKYHIVYKTTNLINGKWYIGKHSTDNLDDGYLGSSQHLKHAIKKYGRDNFIREILVFCASEQEAYEKEAELVTIEVVHNPMTYNKMLGGKGSQKRRTDDEIRERNRERQRKWQEANKESIRERRREYQREYQREYYQANKESIHERRREYQREYYQANKEHKRECYQANKGHKREYQREYYQANKERSREYQREYRQANKEHKREYQREYLREWRKRKKAKNRTIA